MILDSGLRVDGALTYCRRNTRTGQTDTGQSRNLVVVSGRDLICALLARDPRAVGITAFALGQGTSETAAEMVGLEDEIFRNTNITAFTPAPGQGRLRIEYHLSTTEAVPATITEVGLFGGDMQGSVLVARTMLVRPMVRVAHPETGTSDEEVRFSWVLRFRAGVSG